MSLSTRKELVLMRDGAFSVMSSSTLRPHKATRPSNVYRISKLHGLEPAANKTRVYAELY